MTDYDTHGVSRDDLLAVAKRSMRRNRYHHFQYVYLTNLADACDMQETRLIVSYNEPVMGMFDSYHPVCTFEITDAGHDILWYVGTLHSKLEKAWPEAVRRLGLCMGAGQ